MLILPIHDIGVDAVPIRHSVGSIADDIRFVAVIARIVMLNIRIVPRIVPDLFLQIRSLPVLNAFRLLAESL